MGPAPPPTLAIRTPLYLRRLLGWACRNGSPASLLSDGRPLPPRLILERLAFEDGQRGLWARLVGPPLELSAPLTISVLVGDRAPVQFQTRVIDQRPSRVLLEYPVELRQPEHRRFTRTTLEDGRLRVRYQHPSLPERRLGGTVVDVSGQGLAIRVPRTSAPRPGDLLALQLDLPEARVQARALVGRVGALTGTRQAIAGLELVSFDRDGAWEVWRRFVFQQAFPGLGDGVGRASESWDVLDRGGYLSLWTPAGDRDWLRAQYLEAWRPQARPTGHTLLAPPVGRPAGLCANTLVYPGTWMIHHLSRAAGIGEAAPIHLAEIGALMRGPIHLVETEPSARSMIIYLERGKRWNERLYQDFVESYHNPDELLLTPFTVFRRRTDLSLPAATAASVPVAPASAAQLARLAARLQATTPALVRRALALDAGDLALRAFSADCARRGYERQRAIFIAGGADRGDDDLTALIADSGSQGSNVFNLLNSCQLVSLGPGSPTPAVQQALLARASEHYAGLGKREFLLFHPEPDGAQPGAPVMPPPPPALGFERVSGGLRWISDRAVIPSFVGYLRTMLPAADETTPEVAAPRPGQAAAE